VREDESTRLPPVRVLDVAELEAAIRATLDATGRSEEDIWGLALGHLGLVEARVGLDEAVIESFVTNTAAFYDPGDRSVTIIDRGEATDPLDDAWVLSHEFVHALQDRTIGIPQLRRQYVDSTDADVAIDCLIEGEAMVLSTVLLLPALGLYPSPGYWQQFGDRILDLTLEGIAAAPSPLIETIFGLSYGIGTINVGHRHATGGMAAIRALYGAPPTTVLEWAFDDQPGSLACHPMTAPPGFRPRALDRLGVSGVLAMSLSIDGDADAAWNHASAWRDDRIVVSTDDAEPGRAVVAWRIKMASAPSAQALAEVIGDATFPEAIAVSVDGEDIIVQAGPADVLQTWDDTGCAPDATLPDDPSTSSLEALTETIRARIGDVVSHR
jgi:hypothetical protein